MNHRNANIFQAYLDERVQYDVQAAFLGRPSANALIRAASYSTTHKVWILPRILPPHHTLPLLIQIITIVEKPIGII
jgi:Protein of unknown function (DUF3435)